MDVWTCGCVDVWMWLIAVKGGMYGIVRMATNANMGMRAGFDDWPVGYVQVVGGGLDPLLAGHQSLDEVDCRGLGTGVAGMGAAAVGGTAARG
jgi:hypothetical protein